MLASSALLPPYLQSLGGYSVRETGFLMAPRGIGTMITMALVGRLAMRFDPRYIMAAGTILMLWSMWEMSLWLPDIATWTSSSPPSSRASAWAWCSWMNLVSFSTLSPIYRTDGSAVLNIMRNMGSAIGVSITTTFLASATQIAHANLAAHANMFNRNLAQNAPSMMWICRFRLERRRSMR